MAINDDEALPHSPFDQVLRLRPDKLTSAQRAAWDNIRGSNPSLQSPYFHIGYTDLVAKLRQDIYVLIGYINNQPVAFLPIQGLRFSRPVGAPLTDYHGLMCDPSANLDAASLLRRGDIGAFHFDALVDPQGRVPAQSERICAIMDISEGPQAWRERQSSSYRRHLKGMRRRQRKAVENYGEPRFTFNVKDQSVFDSLMAWKRAQYARTGRYDVLSAQWTQEVLQTLFDADARGLRADMHALYFGDRLAAVDLGLADEGGTYHSWITAYDPEFHDVSPGMQLLEALIDEVETLGYRRIDLGPGIDGYKRHYSDDGAGPVVTTGFIAATGSAATLSRLYAAAERFGETAPIGAIGKLPGKVRRRYSQIAACDDSLSGRTKAMFSAVTQVSKS